MNAKHAAPEGGAEARRKLFSQKNLPHFTMAILFITWLYFQKTLGTAGVPPTINEAFAATSGLWFSYVIGVSKGETK
jgi:hypothetical protein